MPFFLLAFLLLTAACDQSHYARPIAHPSDALFNKKFVQGTEDIPLYPHMALLRDTSANYDTAGGRILQATYTVRSSSPETIMQFYRNALPNLGWQHQSGGSQDIYVRENEVLTLTFRQHDRNVRMDVMLEPK